MGAKFADAFTMRYLGAKFEDSVATQYLDALYGKNPMLKNTNDVGNFLYMIAHAKTSDFAQKCRDRLEAAMDEYPFTKTDGLNLDVSLPQRMKARPYMKPVQFSYRALPPPSTPHPPLAVEEAQVTAAVSPTTMTKTAAMVSNNENAKMGAQAYMLTLVPPHGTLGWDVSDIPPLDQDGQFTVVNQWRTENPSGTLQIRQQFYTLEKSIKWARLEKSRQLGDMDGPNMFVAVLDNVTVGGVYKNYAELKMWTMNSVQIPFAGRNCVTSKILHIPQPSKSPSKTFASDVGRQFVTFIGQAFPHHSSVETAVVPVPVAVSGDQSKSVRPAAPATMTTMPDPNQHLLDALEAKLRPIMVEIKAQQHRVSLPDSGCRADTLIRNYVDCWELTNAARDKCVLMKQRIADAGDLVALERNVSDAKARADAAEIRVQTMRNETDACSKRADEAEERIRHLRVSFERNEQRRRKTLHKQSSDKSSSSFNKSDTTTKNDDDDSAITQQMPSSSSSVAPRLSARALRRSQQRRDPLMLLTTEELKQQLAELKRKNALLQREFDSLTTQVVDAEQAYHRTLNGGTTTTSSSNVVMNQPVVASDANDFKHVSLPPTTMPSSSSSAVTVATLATSAAPVSAMSSAAEKRRRKKTRQKFARGMDHDSFRHGLLPSAVAAASRTAYWKTRAIDAVRPPAQVVSSAALDISGPQIEGVPDQ